MLILAGVTAIAGGIIWASWSLIGMWIAPKLVLYSALNHSFVCLEERWEKHPMNLFSQILGGDGEYSAEIDLYAPDLVCGFSGVSGNVDMDYDNKQIKLMGSTISDDDCCNVGFYLDREMAAFHSEKLDSDLFYAVAYDTFSEDIRNIPLVSLFSDMPIFVQWESALQAMKAAMNITAPHNYNLNIPIQSIREFLKVFLLLPCKIERSDSWLNTGFSCCKITYSLDDRTSVMLEKFGIGLKDVLEGGKVSFILHRNHLVQVHAEAEINREIYMVTLMTTENPAFGKAQLSISGNTTDAVAVTVSSNQGKQVLSEIWEVSFEGRTVYASISYSGSCSYVTLCSEDKKTAFTIRSTDSGICFSTTDLMGLFSLLKPEKIYDKSISCSAIVRKGERIAVPKFKYLREWTLDEFAGILTVLAPVFGWKL